MGCRVAVFVDALPYDAIVEMPRIRGLFSEVLPVRPGMGYSVNVKAELFAGLCPDDAGFFNEWRLASGAGLLRPREARIYETCLSILGGTKLGRRGVRFLAKRWFGVDLKNIPPGLLTQFEQYGTNAYEPDFPHESVLSKYRVRRFLDSRLGGDRGALSAAKAALEPGGGDSSIFVALSELDHTLHRFGKGSREYHEHLRYLDRELFDIARRAERAEHEQGTGDFVLVSDHGMANVHTAVRWNLAQEVPGCGIRYLQFVDATIVRIWILEPAVLSDVNQWVRMSRLPGTILSDVMRQQYGISRRDFGDIIFLLDEGFMFAPSFFSERPCAAMHGYLPTLKSQYGVWASSRPSRLSDGAPLLSTVQVYARLCEMYAGTDLGIGTPRTATR